MVKALREILGKGLFLLVSAMYVSLGWKEYFVLKKGMKTAGGSRYVGDQGPAYWELRLSLLATKAQYAES